MSTNNPKHPDDYNLHLPPKMDYWQFRRARNYFCYMRKVQFEIWLWQGQHPSGNCVEDIITGIYVRGE